MITHKLIKYFERNIMLSIFILSLIPYLSLLIYMTTSMHSVNAVATVPSSSFLFFLFLLGVILPMLGIALILKRLIKQRREFKLRMLLEAYFSLILIFATAFAVLQASSETSAIKGMPVVWEKSSPGTLVEHRGRLHMVYYDSLYLSLITITTVGYGDMSPSSAGAKLLTGLEGLAGVGFLGLALGHYFSVCLHDQERDKNE